MITIMQRIHSCQTFLKKATTTGTERVTLLFAIAESAALTGKEWLRLARTQQVRSGVHFISDSQTLAKSALLQAPRGW